MEPRPSLPSASEAIDPEEEARVVDEDFVLLIRDVADWNAAEVFDDPPPIAAEEEVTVMEPVPEEALDDALEVEDR